MGDAVGEKLVGDVELDTIDGVTTPRPEPSSQDPIEPDPGRDYPELVAVERHHYVGSREIAKGGMGRVFEARDRRLGRQVAIKELLPRNRDAARRFEREARITARLQHPAIIHIYEAGVWPGGEPFFAMTKVAGRSLDKVVAERRTLAARIGLLPNVIDVADALAYAHSEHVIHRDLKPANVLVGDFGETVVIDWGLAKDLSIQGDPKESMMLRRPLSDETMSGSIVGTPAYMPPEQARGESVDQRADVYALGALLYHVLVGAAPYVGTASQDVLEQVKTVPPVPLRDREPAAPADLVAIVAKAMARDPDARYASANELAQDLKRFETGQLVAAHNYTTRQLFWRWVRRYRVAVAIATAAVIVLAAAGTFLVHRIITERDRAEIEQATAEHGRAALLDEFGRAEMLAGRAGAALAFLIGAAATGEVNHAREFLEAEAMRSFEAEVKSLDAGRGSVELTASADGKLVATATVGMIRVWTADGTQQRELAMPIVDIHALAFDPAGAWLAVAGGDGQLRLVSVASGSARTFRGHVGAILDVAWSPDGSEVVTAGADRTVRIWRADSADGDMQLSACTAGDRVVSARFSPGGREVASASDDMTACVWKRDDDSNHPLHGHLAAVNTVRWSSDGHVVTASDDGTARVWSWELGKLVMAPLNAGPRVALAEFSPDGRRILTAGSDHVGRIWELPASEGPTAMARGPVELVGHLGAIIGAAFDAGGGRIATVGFDRLVRLWDASTGQPIASFEHADVVGSVAFIADGTRLVTGGTDGTARIWDLGSGVEKQRHLLESGSQALAIAVAPDGMVAVGVYDSTVVLWRREETVLRNHLGRVLAVAFSPDGTKLVTGGEDARPIVWDVKTGKPVMLGKEDARDVSPIRAIVFWPDGTRVVTATAKAVDVWNIENGKLEKTLDPPTELTGLAISPDGIIAGAGTDGTVPLWDTSRLTPVARIESHKSVDALAFNHDGRELVVAGEGYAQIYKIAPGAIAEAHVTLDGLTGSVAAVAFTPDGARVITAGADGVARVWDAAKGKLLGQRVAHGALTSLAVTRDGTSLWLASKTGTISEWDIHASSLSVDQLGAFFALHQVPWRLDRDDVVRLKGAP